MIDDKLSKLKEIVAGYGKGAVAFSGGVDSTFLAGVASDVLGNDMMAVTVTAPFISQKEVRAAREFSRKQGFRHEIIEVDIGDIDLFTENRPDRCYSCKTAVFSRIIESAAEMDIEVVMDASNTDDVSDYRPGMRALKELKVVSPLREAGLAKTEIRELSRRLGYPNWDMPAAACLASRIPYGEKITVDKLERVEKAEEFLHDLGFSSCRVRSHGDIARIELPSGRIGELVCGGMREKAAEHLRSLGFKYITVDIEGYRMGSLNESLDI